MSKAMFEQLRAHAPAFIDLLQQKNEAYGNSFADSELFIRALWPDGVPVESYGLMLTFARMFDKMKRMATSPKAFGEDPVKDMVGYSMLMWAQQMLASPPAGAIPVEVLDEMLPTSTALRASVDEKLQRPMDKKSQRPMRVKAEIPNVGV
jgi:hypothetical protein